jgi:hypothetical protein
MDDKKPKGQTQSQVKNWENRFHGRIMMGKAYRTVEGGEDEYLGKFLNNQQPIKTELFRGKNNSFTRRSIYGFETAAGDTTLHEYENTSRNLSMLRSMEGLDVRSDIIAGKPGVDYGAGQGKSAQSYLDNWGTPTAAQTTKNVTNKVMNFLKGLKK